MNSVYIRPLQASDMQGYLAMFSSTVQNALFVSSLQQEQDYLIVHLEQQKHGMTHFYGIFLSNNNQCIGAIEIRNRDAYRGQLYCWIHENYWGTGYFIQAMQNATHDYFLKTGQRYINALVATSNKRSYRALKKCEFADSGFYTGIDGDSYELILRCDAIKIKKLLKFTFE